MNKIDDYVGDILGWQGELARMLRREIMAAGGVTEAFKWGNPIFESGGGPVCLFKVYSNHVTLGFWRGQQMGNLEPLLTPSGSYRGRHQANERGTDLTPADPPARPRRRGT